MKFKNRFLSFGMIIILLFAIIVPLDIYGAILKESGERTMKLMAGYESAWFPAPSMNLTQLAYESYSHGECNAIDIAPGGRVFAPFTGKIVYKNNNWGYVLFQSNDKVYYADGTLDYMTVGFMHDSDISDLYIGKEISQGSDFYDAGGMGNGNPNAYGYHVDISVLKGQVNSVTRFGRGDVYAYNAFFINGTKTTSIINKGVVESGNVITNGNYSNWSNLWKEYSTYHDPEGCFDIATGGRGTVYVRGWAFDRDVLGEALRIHVYVGGAAGSGAPGYEITANKSRPDVNEAYSGVGENHGFDDTISVSVTGTKEIYVYALNSGGGNNNPLLGSKTVTITESDEAPVISNCRISNLSKSGFDISCTVKDDYGVSKVMFPTWTKKSDQDDLFENWETNEKCRGTLSGTTASYHVDTSMHNNETGLYIVHIYAYDDSGNSTRLRAAISVGENSGDYEAEPLSQKTYNGHTYMLFQSLLKGGTGKNDWNTCATFCQSIGGHLVTISSKEENDAVAEMVSAYGDRCWIGLNCLEKAGEFVWESGDTFSYSNWYPTQPDNSSGIERVVEMYKNGMWNDNTITETNAFICEWDSEIFQPSESSVLLGDVNGDEKVNNKDVAYLARSLVGKEALSEEQKEAADVNGDGTVNNKDVAKLARYLVGKETRLGK